MLMNTHRYLDTNRFKWPLLALWISIGLHGALIASVKIVPPKPAGTSAAIEARLLSGVSTQPATVKEEIPLLRPEPQATKLDEALAYAPPPPATPSATAATPEPRPVEASSLPQIEIPLAVDLHYYAARELDITPSAEIAEPELPASVSGKIQYRVKIEPDGRVSEVDVIKVELVPDNDSSALAGTEAILRATRFKPGIKAGRAVRSVVIYELLINPVPTPR